MPSPIEWGDAVKVPAGHRLATIDPKTNLEIGRENEKPIFPRAVQKFSRTVVTNDQESERKVLMFLDLPCASCVLVQQDALDDIQKSTCLDVNFL